MSTSSSSNTISSDASSASTASSLRAKLMSHIGTEAEKKHSKVTIVGAGAVGLAAAYAILNQGITSELCLVDVSQRNFVPIIFV